MVAAHAPTASARALRAASSSISRKALAAGRWPPGALMPSEAELVAEFGVSRMTVNRALRELQAEGLVDRSQGVGTFAAQLYRVSSTLTIRDLHEEIDVARPSPPCRGAPAARGAGAARRSPQRLGLATGAPVFHTLIVHHENGVPLQCEDRYVNPACAPGYLERRLHADHADALPARGGAALGGAVRDRGQRADRAGGAAARHRAATTPASSSCAAP